MRRGSLPRVFDYFERKAASPPCSSPGGNKEPTVCSVSNYIIGNNAVAVDAAGREAERRGYTPALTSAANSEGSADDVGRHLARDALLMRGRPGPDCLISGGEPVVRLAEPSRRGLGGRNQQLVLAAVARLWKEDGEGIAILSGGTDGEDGPTDAAGALLDAPILATVRDWASIRRVRSRVTTPIATSSRWVCWSARDLRIPTCAISASCWWAPASSLDHATDSPPRAGLLRKKLTECPFRVKTEAVLPGGQHGFGSLGRTLFPLASPAGAGDPRSARTEGPG